VKVAVGLRLALAYNGAVKRTTHACCKCGEMFATFALQRQHLLREHVNVTTNACLACDLSLPRRTFSTWMKHLLDECRSERAEETLTQILPDSDDYSDASLYTCAICNGSTMSFLSFVEHTKACAVAPTQVVLSHVYSVLSNDHLI